MEKLNMQTANVADENFRKLMELFPNAVTETINDDGEVVRCIDKDVLSQEISTRVVEGREERYQFTWPDKRKAVIAANAPTSCTLRPCREESVDFDTTQNLYIEGDNLEVLKLLQENYLGKVKMIYIDPPYNTGNDFVYEDDFAESVEEYRAGSGQYDAEGNRLVQNTESNGRFHTDWLNMIYPRLKLARNLLSDDGVIFISIDDNEVENLRKALDEVFGENNFIAQMIWQGGKVNTAKFISASHEYILLFAKNLQYCKANNVIWRIKKSGLEAIYKKVEELRSKYPLAEATKRLKEWYKSEAPVESRNHAHYCNIDSKGVYCMDNVSRVGGGKYSIVNPINGVTINPPSRGWVFGKEDELWKAYIEGILEFLDNDKLPILKRYLKDNEYQLLDTVFYKDRRGARIRLKSLMDKEVFDFPKDESVIQDLISAFADKSSLILDFFSGSATTAHAVMQLNAEDGGKRRFIMVQLPEETAEGSEARKAGYRNICEIGKERIRRAGRKIREESPLTTQDLDTGFRVLKLDSSNMQDVYYTPQEFVSQSLWDATVDNIKPGRTAEDLLFQVMLELDIPLSAKVSVETIDCHEVFNVEEGYLIACFDENLTDETITAIAKRKPYYFVMRDASMADDSVAVNFEQIFRSYSPDTTLKVL